MHLPLHAAMTNREIAEVLSFISQVLGMRPGNLYRARAYEEAAVVVQHLGYELQDRWQKLRKKSASEKVARLEFEQQLDALPGIGAAISQKLGELYTTGNIAAFQKYTAPLPGGMFSLVKLHGIGAKKAFKLAEQFGLENPDTAVAELLTKAKHGMVRGLTGFGEKSELQLIQQLEHQHSKARIPRKEAQHVAETIAATLQQLPSVSRVESLGSLRRGADTVGDIDLGIVSNDPAGVLAAVQALPMVKRTLVAGEQLISVVVNQGWQVDIKFAPQSEWGSFIQHFTGDKQHNIALREYALKQGFSLSEHGIKNTKTGELQTFDSEEAFYAFLGMQHIPPAERVGGEELVKYRLQR